MAGSNPIYSVDLDNLAYGGEVIGRLPDGRAVFVPFALPGEQVRVRLVESKRGFARGELLEVLTPSPERIDPRCRHFGECGGCHYQHMSYEAQLRAKAEILRDQLERIGGLSEPAVSPAVPSPVPWNYRNHVQFHLAPEGEPGYHVARSERVLPIQECHLPEERLNRIWPQLDVEPAAGIDRIGLRAGAVDTLLVLESRSPEPPEFSVDLPISAVHLGPDAVTPLAGDPTIRYEVLGRIFQVSADTFFQVNTALAGAMVAHLREHLPLSLDTTLLELYCGAGLFSAFLAPAVDRLVGVEIAESACDDFEANLAEFDHVELHQGRVEDVLPQLSLHPDVILVDPPRAGLGRQVLDAILDLAPGMVAYVSCDPATLARDAGRLVKGGYRLVNTTPFDLFPQTYHIESISILTSQPDV